MNKFIVSATIAAAATFGLAFAPAAAAQPYPDERDFITLLESVWERDIPKSAEASFIEAGYASCEALDYGLSPEVVASQAAKQADLPMEVTATVVVSAVYTLCPEHIDRLHA